MVWNDVDKLQAFAAANVAYRANPFNGTYRIQLALSLDALMRSGRDVRLAPQAADRAFQIAASASPVQAAVLVSRANYLFASGRWKDSDEIARIAAQLERTARTYPQTWMVVAGQAGLTGQHDKAAKALVMGLETGAKLADMQRVAHSINMEIDKQ